MLQMSRICDVKAFNQTTDQTKNAALDIKVVAEVMFSL